MHSDLDLNLLVALNVLLEEESVSGAASRMGLSSPAMSRTLARVRQALGDPVLVRAGRRMVPTPRALAIRAEVHRIAEEAQALLRPGAAPLVPELARSFTIQADDAAFSAIGVALMERVRGEAPGVTLRFIGQNPAGQPMLREGTVDLQIGSQRTMEPEIRVEKLLLDRPLGAVRVGHPLLDGGRKGVTVGEFAAADHLIVSRRGRLTGHIDELLAERGLRRHVIGTAPTFAASLFVLLRSDAVGLIGSSLSGFAAHSLGLETFEVPLPLEPVDIVQAWHPRNEVHGAHLWLRGVVRDIARELARG